MCRLRSTAIERPGVSETPCAPTGSSLGVKPGLAEEHVGLVLPPQLLAVLRIGFHPLPDALHRHFFARHDLALDQELADRNVRMAVLRHVVQAQQLAVVELDAHRALDVDEERIDRILQPADFQTAAGEHAVVDRGAIVVRHQPALAALLALAGRDPGDRHAAAGQQIGRLAIERMLVLVGLLARAFDDRLVIAGEKTVRRRRAAKSGPAGSVCSKNSRAALASFGLASTAFRHTSYSAPNIGRASRMRRVPRRIALQLCMKVTNAAAWSSSTQPSMSIQVIGSYCVSDSFSGFFACASDAPVTPSRISAAAPIRPVLCCRRPPD